MIQQYIEDIYGEYLDQLYIYENKDSLKLSAIVLNKEKREGGIGTKIMDYIIDYADKTGKIVVLTPSSDYGGSKQRLIKFYKSFGFVWNRAHNKDFRFQDTMIRYPKTMNEMSSKNIKESFNEYSNDALTDMIINLSRFEGNEEAIQRVKKELNKRKGIVENKIKGGLADGKTMHDIVMHHGEDSWASIQFESLEKQLEKQLEKGIKAEMEHTSDAKVAREIAMDHLWEDRKYYDKLETMEENKIIIKKLLKEEIDLQVTDESPDTITILVEYNDRNAGIIMVTPANVEKTLEIVGIKFKKDYETVFIINEAVKSLWGMFKEINDLIVAPEPEGVAFWNKLGFSRISPNYLILQRGH